MQVKIIKCSNPEYWYNNQIGKIFNVLKEKEFDQFWKTWDYIVINPKDSITNSNSIVDSDCEVYEEEEKIQKPSFEELEQAAQPLIDILYKYYNPHTIIIIEQDHVEILCGNMVVPIKIKN